MEEAEEGYRVTLADASAQYYAREELRRRSQERRNARSDAPAAAPREDLPPLYVDPADPITGELEVPSRRRGPWWLFRTQ